MIIAQRRFVHSRVTAIIELVTGLCLLGGAAFVGVVFVHRPKLNALDVFGFRELSPASTPTPRFYAFFLAMGSVRVLIGAVVVAVAVTLWRDWRRSVAYIAGALLAVFITESIAKPLVAGNVAGFGGHSYPSGTVTAVAALVTALTLATPSFFRIVVGVLGALCVCAASAAVIAVRWHFPTDALGGALVGCGSVVFFDGLMHVFTRHRTDRAAS